jgi:hypothetical protein
MGSRKPCIEAKEGKSSENTAFEPSFDEFLLVTRKSGRIADLLRPYLKKTDFSEK